MKIPVVQGVIDRRILVNYRVDPDVLRPMLPAALRPKLIHGTGIAGICLIRLRHVRPRLLPAWLGIGSENAAHRVAVEWDEGPVVKTGVFIWRRDTGSWFNCVTGGRIFPGVHHHARFTVRETAEHFHVAVKSDDGVTSVSVSGHRTQEWPASSLFTSLREASDFFRTGALGYSPAHDGRRLQGLELNCRNWEAEPLAVESVHSSFFEDESVFPRGSIAFDSAVLMRGIEHEWLGKPDLCCSVAEHAAC